jgi:hypothetical protein
MTDSDSRTVPYWSGKTAGEITEAARARPEGWARVPGYGSYEWSDQGSVRSVDREVGGRRLRGRILKTRVNNSGYVIVNVRTDAGAPVTVAVAPMVLLAHHPAFRGRSRFPEGLETRHGPAGPLCNAYPENLWPGTKGENHADQVAAGTAVVPESFECVNFARCGGRVKNPGRRCLPCVEQTGRDAGQLLNAGMGLADVAERFGYSDGRWVHGLAAKFGGYAGTITEARAQRPTLAQRARLVGLVRLQRRAAGRPRSDAS